MKRTLILLIATTFLIQACDGGGGVDSQALPTSTREKTSNVGTPAARPPTKSAEDKWDLWVDGPHLRGADLHPCSVIDEDRCVEPVTFQDVQDLHRLGANLINASYPGVFSVDPGYEVDAVSLAYLDNLISWAEDIGIYVVIHFRTGPGRNEAAIHQSGGEIMEVWTDQVTHDAWVEMWRFVAERYRESPVIVGYNLMVEPLANLMVDPGNEMEPEEVQSQLESTLMDWNSFTAEITEAIRDVDQDTPIIIDSLNWASAAWFSVLKPTRDARIVYSLHTYDPDAYTTQGEGDDSLTYPSIVEDSGETITFDIIWLEENFQPVLEFSQKHDVPIYVGEFGAMRWVPNADAFIYDQTALFEEYGWNYAFYVWRGDEVYFDGFNMEYGSDPSNHSPDLDNEILSIHLQRWAHNEYFPGAGN